MNVWILPILVGALAGAALCLLAALFVPTTPDIGDTLDRLYTARPAPATAISAPTTGVERFGARVQQHLRFFPTTVSDADLQALGMSPAYLYGTKAVTALCGASCSILLGALQALLGMPSVAIPGLVGILLGVGGWLLPDLLTKGNAAVKREELVRTVTSYYDLVTLMRLSGATVMDSINVPAQIADAPLFVKIRGALARQQLEHKRPWEALTELSDEIELPELRDLGDLMALSGERGTPAAGMLRAKARDLRGYRLNQDIEVAQRDLQRQVVAQVILLIGIMMFLMIPPLLRLIG